MNKNEKKRMEKILKGKEFSKAFDLITESNWWGDENLTSDMERENSLYKTYFDYYYLIFAEGVDGIAVKEGYIYMHQLKLQLDKELEKIKKSIYQSEEELESEN